MATLKKYQLNGKQVGQEQLEESFVEVDSNAQMIKDYIVAIRANARQWSASTKGRSDVNHSTQKPHRQKGLGRARQGSLAATQYKGGGRPFGPRPKFDQHVKINKREKRLAIRQLLAEKIKEGHFCLLETTDMTEPKTKIVDQFLKTTGWKGKRVLFLAEGAYEYVQADGVQGDVSAPCKAHRSLLKSIRNLPRVEFSLSKNVSGYDVLLANVIFATPGALSEIKQWLA